MAKNGLTTNTLETGFTVSWLSRAFGVSQYFVRKLLADAPVKGKGGKANLYDIREAAKRLIHGDVDWDELLRKINKRDLPAHLQTEIWAARRAEQRFRQDAGELWSTDAVLDVLTSVLAVVRSRVVIWPDTLERQTGLTADQRDRLMQLADSLLDDVHDAILEESKKHTTPPALDDLTVRMDNGTRG